jgi:hypothetical protein
VQTEFHIAVHGHVPTIPGEKCNLQQHVEDATWGDVVKPRHSSIYLGRIYLGIYYEDISEIARGIRILQRYNNCRHTP